MANVFSIRKFGRLNLERSRRLPFPASYLVALLAVAAAALLRLWLPGPLGSTPFLAFYPALVFAAAFGGFGPGLLSVLTSWLCVTLFFDSTPGYIGLSNPSELWRLLVFLSGGVGATLVCEAQLRGQERILKQAQALEELRQLTDSGPFLIRDHEDRILHWSDGCTRLYGFTPDQALWNICHRILQTKFPEPLKKIREDLFKNGRWDGELTHVRSDGTLLTVASTWILRDKDAAPVVLEISNDITRLKCVEEDLLRAGRELARSNKDLESFAYIASHDLLEPLRTIAGFLQLLEKKIGPQLDDKAKQYIDFAVDGSKRMHQMITDLLFYSRVSLKTHSPKTIDFREPLEQALASLRQSIKDSQASVVIRDLPRIPADEAQMLQVFQNLLGNSIKFRSERPLQIEVGCEKEQQFWKLWIRDNGIGFDPRQQEKIFLIFQRLHSRQKYPGNGIGLSVCKKIIERHGGSIWAESRPGIGSTFYFTLPANGFVRN